VFTVSIAIPLARLVVIREEILRLSMSRIVLDIVEYLKTVPQRLPEANK
jgi:hypothetical protein